MAKEPEPYDRPAKVGRKPRGHEAGKMVGVLMTANERAAYEADAKRRKMSLSEWIRAACAAFLKRRGAR